MQSRKHQATSFENPYSLVRLRERWSNETILWLAVIVLGHVAFLVLYREFRATFVELTKEDGWLEYGSSLMFAVASVLAFIRVGRTEGLGKVWVVAFGVLALIMAGEEISWGQRIFEFEVSAIQEANVQGETNLHNLEGFSTGRVLSIMSLGIGVLAPVGISLLPWLRRIVVGIVKIPLPHPLVCLCMIISYVWYWQLHPGSQYPVSIEESREFTIALGVLLYARYLGWELRTAGGP